MSTPLEGIDDADLSEMIEELRALRVGRFADTRRGFLIHFLTAFFLPDHQTTFVPILSKHLSIERVLTRTPMEIGGCVLELIRELSRVSGSHRDNHENQKLYLALNSLLRPICKRMTRSRKNSRR